MQREKWEASPFTAGSSHRGRNITAMLGVVHSNQDMIFVQKVLFIGIVSTLADS
ncbi:hypothetical protein SBON0708_004150 [Salmonella bongori serovar 48:i:- str. 94-0708]|nr:hypothetical protein [Salmonella bongori serovar 48:i:- str. 94-0708]